MAASRMPNKVHRAKIVPLKRGAGFRRASGNIAAIDFGTKNCSLAYVTGGDTGLGLGGLNKLRLNGTHTRVPTAVLLDRDKRVVKFGYDARERYSHLDVRARENVYYFDGIKVNLQRDEHVSRDVPVRALNGKDLRLVEVIAQILGYLKRELIDNHLKKAGHHFTAEDFDWVVTVPAIWLASGKQMMRLAAKMAGLCSEENPDRLSLALEPESGAIYCHEMRKRGHVAYPTPHPNSTPSTPPSYSYLIVDIGGGTVDVSAHSVSTTPTLSVEELHHPDGNNWGGLQVNLKFSEFLQKLVGDRKFSRYLQVNDADAKILNRFDVDELMNVTFERVKKTYCRSPRDEREEVFIKLPDSFLNEYGETLVASLEAKTKELQMEGRENEIVTLRDSILRIPPSKMEQFLQPAVDGITQCIDNLLATLSNTGVEMNTIYLVGGFGGCHYIYELFTERYGEGRGIIVPPNPEFAIVEGAVLFRANPGIVRSRKADATYGKSVVRHFESFHDPRYRQGNHCYHLFQTIVGRGESIRPDCLYMAVSRPLSLDQRRMHFEVFSSVKKAEELWYTRDEGVVPIGELVLELPEVGRMTRDREVEIFFDFSHTEIQVRACEKSSKAEVKAVLDFLSAIPPGQRRKVRVQEEQVMGVDERDGHRKHEDEEEKKNEEEGGRGGRGRIW